MTKSLAIHPDSAQNLTEFSDCSSPDLLRELDILSLGTLGTHTQDVIGAATHPMQHLLSVLGEPRKTHC